mmetsp:Transcript_14147/g.46818  ORF Transcript_14147/g.46818 Transcript_14147/m.46818 type:complete len:275 (-) Transcript_14147:111-935(-)
MCLSPCVTRDPIFLYSSSACVCPVSGCARVYVQGRSHAHPHAHMTSHASIVSACAMCACAHVYVCGVWSVRVRRTVLAGPACTLRLDAVACTSSGAHRAIGGASPALGSGATALYLGVRITLQPDPSAAAPPVSCSTFSYSSASISSLRCVTYTTAGDSASSASEASVSRSRSRLCPERPCVGSSRRSSLGRLTRARQSSTSFCWPCERWKKVWLTRPASPAEAAEAEAAPKAWFEVAAEAEAAEEAAAAARREARAVPAVDPDDHTVSAEVDD